MRKFYLNEQQVMGLFVCSAPSLFVAIKHNQLFLGSIVVGFFYSLCVCGNFLNAD